MNPTHSTNPIVHINRQHVAMNRRDGGRRPVYIVCRGKEILYAHAVEILGAVRFVDPREHPPLPCGARVWLEVISGQLTLTEPCEFSEARQSAEPTEPTDPFVSAFPHRHSLTIVCPKPNAPTNAEENPSPSSPSKTMARPPSRSKGCAAAAATKKRRRSSAISG